MEPTTAESVCNLVIRSRLLSAEEVHPLYQRWRGEAGPTGTDATPFISWLADRQYLTEYQANWLLRGRVDHFFLHQYKLLDRIGRGSMAGVYKAVHQLGQVVAIKILPPSKAAEPSLLGRFQREARLALRLKHPNIVRTFQVGQTAALHYIVMEYLEGETLDEVLQRRRKLPAAEAVRLIHQALLGLQHLHEQGMVHRDLKPGNLMLVPPRAPGMPDQALNATVKIMDIGLGRALFDEGTPGGADNFQLTSEGAILGTPDYLAPEQARNARLADVRADIYSLGCVLYHALTGQPPFVETNLVRQLVRHATETPRPLRELNATIPEGLQPILAMMLAKDPANRYPTPERAAQALQGFLAGGSEPAPASASPPKNAYMKWLDSQPVPPEENAEPPPAKPPAPEPSPRPMSRPAAATAPAAGATAPKRTPKAPAAAPPRPAPVPPPVPPHKNRPPVPKKKGPTNAEADLVDVELIPVPAEDQAGSISNLVVNLSRRDYLLMGIGAGCLLVLELVGFFVGYLLFRKKDDTSDEPSSDRSRETEPA
jgi:serine/threonine protein kinase